MRELNVYSIIEIYFTSVLILKSIEFKIKKQNRLLNLFLQCMSFSLVVYSYISIFT